MEIYIQIGSVPGILIDMHPNCWIRLNNSTLTNLRNDDYNDPPNFIYKNYDIIDINTINLIACETTGWCYWWF